MTRPRLRRLLAGALIAVLPAAAAPAPSTAAPAAPDVVASIKPVHGLVAGVMAGVGEPALLVRGAASPHGYAMRPSDARRLAEAEVVFWIGPPLETFLAGALAALDPRPRIVALWRAPGLDVLAVRPAGVFGAAGDDGAPAPASPPGESPTGGHDHDGAVDPHVWLDPGNARAIVRTAAAALAAADPAHGAAYRANAARLEARIAALDAELAAMLAPVRDVPYVVHHDAYQYLERHYGLAAVGALSAGPERPPGARRVRELREAIRATGARCVFTEPQFTPALARSLAADTGARLGALDPLGAALPAGPEFYFALMRDLGRSLVDCLGAGERG